MLCGSLAFKFILESFAAWQFANQTNPGEAGCAPTCAPLVLHWFANISTCPWPWPRWSRSAWKRSKRQTTCPCLLKVLNQRFGFICPSIHWHLFILQVAVQLNYIICFLRWQYPQWVLSLSLETGHFRVNTLSVKSWSGCWCRNRKCPSSLARPRDAERGNILGR